LKKYFFIFLTAVFCVSASAYTRLTINSGETPKWSSMPVSYWINEKGLQAIANGSEFAAIHNSFRAWENVTSADVRMSYRGTTSAGAANDGQNIISFADGAWMFGSSTIAVTLTYFRTEIGSDNALHSVIRDADIVFNPNLNFSTSAEDSKYDIQSVLTHEVGHFLGLDHSGLISSVMVPFAAVAQLDQRTLAYDDIAGITEIYPSASANAGAGRIQGTIRSNGAAVFGASVIAFNSDGTPLVSTLSQPDGSYALRFLPAGVYRVVAEPLDLPVSRDNIGGGTTGFYSTIRTDFGTTYFGNVGSLSEARTVTVAASGTVTADIQTLPRSATRLNMTRPSFGVRIARGRSGTLTVGGEDLTAGISFSASNSGLILGAPTFGGAISSSAPTSARMQLSIFPGTPLGPKSLAANRGSEATVVAGALIITDPAPSSITVAPANGLIDLVTPVTIRGENFRPGAEVYFGGIAASDVNVVDSGTILANAPQNAPGAMNVVILNADGTWGVGSRAFTYDALPPAITRITPTSGAPTTLVTIEGANFDSHIQNVSVQFNGMPARIIGTTANLITAIVPYGATTGPITVTVFEKSVASPAFTVTPIPVSANVATPVFNFVNAGAEAGGVNLGFSSSDDAVTSQLLPFTFSLFGDVYLAGSPVYISTNGFISFESVSASLTFQNGPLPGQSVSQPLGGTGTIPPSLVAPFWDDLMMKSGSTISARTVGDAPNRRFVVQWSDMTILDEEGDDQNANLTFELILFEGSNDIQFLYRTATGPFADGSSATIGLQDSKRTSAVQSGFNQPLVGSQYFRGYRFNSGRYTEMLPDNTPPATPVVTDEGAVTARRTELAASWLASDAESAIREFQYAIGTTPGGTQVKPFTSTALNSVVVTGLNLQAGTLYYFVVKAINGAGLESAAGVSDGIRYDAAYQPQVKIIPPATEGNAQFTGVALLAPAAMTVVLRAYDANGALVLRPGIRNPSVVSLAAGQQHARLLSELFGLETFDGWIEVEASASGLGIFTATGSSDLAALDGVVARDVSSNFVLFHAGASASLVNPSSRVANVTMTSLTGGTTQSLTIPPRGLFTTTLQSAVRIQSSEALAAIERSAGPGKLAMNEAVPVADAQASLVFPHAVVGAGYTSTLNLANVGNSAVSLNLSFRGVATPMILEANTSTRFSLASVLGLNPGNVITTGAVAVATSASASIVGVLDIENQSGVVTIGTRPAATEFAFPHVANVSGVFTGLAIAAGANGARVTIDVYPPGGGVPRSGTVTLTANQHLGRLVNELVPNGAGQTGGYIRVRSDQPITAWEIYGSDEAMASGPPL
jgi:hypothetical protein